MKLLKKRPGFQPKWVSPEKIEKSLMHGYAFCEPQNYGVERKIIGESNKNGSRIVRREMTLMEITQESYEKRKAFMAEKNRRSERSYRKELEQATAQTQRELGVTKPLMTDETKKS